MKKFPYTGERIYQIFAALQGRGLAMFLGVVRGEPMIWMDGPLPYRAPVSIATAEMLLDEITTRELDGRVDYELLVGEVLDGAPVAVRRIRPRLALAAGGVR